jgi:tetratricopeptide (TPR) repeat protein
MSWRAAGLALALAVIVSRPALADPQAATAYAEGQRLYNAGHYLDAADAFLDAYRLEPDPAYLFNIAQAYRLGNACAKAAEYYRKFAAAFREPPNPDKLQRYIDDMDACAATQTDLLEPRAPSGETGALAERAGRDQPHATSEPGGTRRTVGIAVAAGGGAVVIAGIAFGLAAGTLAEHRDQLCPAPCTWSAGLQARADELDSRGHRDAVISILSLGAGTAALAGGIALYMIGRPAGHDVAVVPTAGGAVMSAGFAF